MSNRTRNAVGIVVALLLLCCISVAVVATIGPRLLENFVADSFTDEPGDAAAIGQEIVDYELPAGYEEEGGMSVMGMQTVFIESRRGISIMLMKFPEALAGDQDQMREMMEQQTGMGTYDLAEVEREEVTINGETAVLRTSEGRVAADESGDASLRMRQITGVFQAKDGSPAMLMITGPAEGWDERGINAFLGSLQGE